LVTAIFGVCEKVSHLAVLGGSAFPPPRLAPQRQLRNRTWGGGISHSGFFDGQLPDYLEQHDLPYIVERRSGIWLAQDVTDRLRHRMLGQQLWTVCFGSLGSSLPFVIVKS
jgi:hypothetical protein